MSRPADWKNYEDFAAGIDTNRLPATAALVGQTFNLSLGAARPKVSFLRADLLSWEESAAPEEGTYESILVAPHTYFVDVTFTSRPREALTLIMNTATGSVMSVRSVARAREIPGHPLVEQIFDVGTVGNTAGDSRIVTPGPTRDLIGLRAFYRYSPNHLYEHTYLSSQRYCWQCLIGEQRGHGDVDLATTYKFDTDQYLFTFREFIIPVASVFFLNFQDRRSTGKFLGLTGNGVVRNNKAGSFIEKASMTYYEPGAEPI
jgi:molybdenum cofactor biosynthesis protein MoaF